MFICELSDRHLQYKCGSTINPYFSVVKLIWLMENIPQVSKAIQEERCMFGTMDSWLIWVITDNLSVLLIKMLGKLTIFIICLVNIEK